MSRSSPRTYSGFHSSSETKDRQTGLLVPENSPNALAGAIGWLMTNPDRAERFARAAQVLVQREFYLSITAAQLHSLIGRSASVHVGSALTNCAT